MLRKLRERFGAHMDRRALARDIAENAINFALDRKTYGNAISGKWPASGSHYREGSLVRVAADAAAQEIRRRHEKMLRKNPSYPSIAQQKVTYKLSGGMDRAFVVRRISKKVRKAMPKSN